MDGLLGNLFGIQEEDPLLAMLPPEQRARLQAQTRSQGITNLGLALLQAGGPTRTPGGFGQALGQAGMQAMQANQGLMDRGLERMLAARKIQQEETQRQQMESTLAGLSEEDQRLYRLLGQSGFGQVMAQRAKPAESRFGKIDPKDYTAASIASFQETGDPSVLVPREKPQEPEKFSGAYGNLALGMFGTANIGQLTPEQRQAVDAEARRRGLERPPSTVINMPTESERTAGFLANRLQGGLQQLRAAVGEAPSAASPTLGAEAVKFVTGSDYLKNLTNPEARQRVEAAQLEILDSALTLGTGAAYTREQLQNYQKSYFPQLGDKPATVAEKQKRLENLLQAARVKAGRAAPTDLGLPAGVTVREVK
jgi:hypothetical protein